MERIKIEIGIDCPPCTPRPNTYIGLALNILVIATSENVLKEPVSKSFGAWVWEFECDKRMYQSKRDELTEAYNKYYEAGLIRGFYHREVEN